MAAERAPGTTYALSRYSGPRLLVRDGATGTGSTAAGAARTAAGTAGQQAQRSLVEDGAVDGAASVILQQQPPLGSVLQPREGATRAGRHAFGAAQARRGTANSGRWQQQAAEGSRHQQHHRDAAAPAVAVAAAAAGAAAATAAAAAAAAPAAAAAAAGELHLCNQVEGCVPLQPLGNPASGIHDVAVAPHCRSREGARQRQVQTPMSQRAMQHRRPCRQNDRPKEQPRQAKSPGRRSMLYAPPTPAPTHLVQLAEGQPSLAILVVLGEHLLKLHDRAAKRKKCACGKQVCLWGLQGGKVAGWGRAASSPATFLRYSQPSPSGAQSGPRCQKSPSRCRAWSCTQWTGCSVTVCAVLMRSSTGRAAPPGSAGQREPVTQGGAAGGRGVPAGWLSNLLCRLATGSPAWCLPVDVLHLRAGKHAAGQANEQGDASCQNTAPHATPAAGNPGPAPPRQPTSPPTRRPGHSPPAAQQPSSPPAQQPKLQLTMMRNMGSGSQESPLQ